MGIMLKRFIDFIRDNSLCEAGDTILATVSGGVDSVVMLDLLIAAGYRTAIAHCNFKLRGNESDADADFVESLAADYSVRFHKIDFQTGKHAADEGISVQMAARNLRYSWFEEIRAVNNYHYIATAHNQDDILETFFINLSRGTGIRGLTGIPSKSGKLIRPLLFASREDIMDHATTTGLSYREDSSNASEKYLRNKIRHRLLPMLEEQNPSFRRSMMETISKLSETEKLFREELDNLKKDLLAISDDRATLSIPEIEKLGSKRTILYEILTNFNFSSASVEDILNSFDGPPGKQFFSSTHRLVKDRNELIITALKEEEDRKYYLDLDEGRTYDPLDLEWIVVENTDNFSIPKDPNIACFDLDLLDFPLILRHWKKGDYFQPFGMQGIKKISDFLIDEKVSIPDKENTWMLASGHKILWVIGRRIDEKFRITGKTRQVLMVKFSPGARKEGR